MKVFIIFVLLASILRCLVMGNETDMVEVLRQILDEMNNKSIAREEASKQEMKDFIQKQIASAVEKLSQSILSPSSVADLVSQYGNSTVAIGYIRDGTFSFEILGSGFLSKTLENYFVVTTCAHVVTGFNGPIRVRFSINLHFVHYCKIIDSDVKTDFALLGCIKTDNFPEYAVNAPANLPSEQYQATGMKLLALVYSAFSPQSYEPIVLNMASFHPAIGNLTIHVKEDLLRLNSGGLVLTVVDGEAFTVGICLGNNLLYFEDRPVRFAVDGDKKEDVRLYHNKSHSFSPILAPVHVSGIISRADAFRTHGDSVYDDFDSNDSEIVLLQI